MTAERRTVTRQELKDMVDSLSPAELYAAKRYLMFLRYLDDPDTRVVVEGTDEQFMPDYDDAVPGENE